MKISARYALVATLLTVGSLSYTSSAYAWGCTAEDPEGASGWSSGFQSKRAAAKRAVLECNSKSNPGAGECYVTECNIDW